MSKPWQGAAAPIAPADMRRAAETIGCDVAALQAVWEVESAGSGFRSDRSVERRFEPHHMPRNLWGKIGFSPGNQAPWRASLNMKQAAREAMFDRAYSLDAEAAMRAASWGAPQVMGFNAQAAGFTSARQMVEVMAQGEAAQIDAFVQLVMGWKLDSALRAHDWLALARRYNGSGQPEVYARRMEAAYRRHAGGEGSAQVLRVGGRGAAVKRLQEALGIEADGRFGPETLARVEAFQRAQGLKVDGVAGHRTWSRIEDLAKVSAPKQETPAKHIEREIGKWTGIATAVGGAAAALSEALDGIPDAAWPHWP